MRVDTLRQIDRYLGIPLCWIVSLARRAHAFLWAKPVLPKPQKVLIIKLAEMGSTVLAYPALTELKNRCPDVKLYFLVFAKNSAIIEVLKLALTENHHRRLSDAMEIAVERVRGDAAAFPRAVRHSDRHGFFWPADGVDRLYCVPRQSSRISPVQ